ncbi:MAG: diacylglycerol kinase family protein, partial [Pseudomonadota bacterium]|nr:diacylglycerol kinase family protein [Pseudomonadota bacterium]
MAYWLICNSGAGDGERGRDFWLEHLATAGIHDPLCRDFEESDWSTRLDDRDTLIVAGGDGSVSRAAAVCLEKGATLAVLPSGTANDFARNLGLPHQPGALCKLIASGRTQM